MTSALSPGGATQTGVDPASRLLTEIGAAVQAEIAATRRQLGHLVGVEVPLRAGVVLRRDRGRTLVRFSCAAPGEGAEAPAGPATARGSIAPETRALLRADDGQQATAVVVYHDADSQALTLELQSEGWTATAAEATFDATGLLEELRARIRRLARTPERLRLPTALLAGRVPTLDRSTTPRNTPGAALDAHLNPEQARAIGFALGSPISFLWGPPGCGKTHTLGRLVAALVARGERVLVAAHTNVATDGAAAAVLDALAAAGEASTEVVRVGRSGDGLARRGVALEDRVGAAVAGSARWLVADLLEAERAHRPAEADAPADELLRAAVRRLLLGQPRGADEQAMAEDVDRVARQVVRDARVVCATLCGATMSRHVRRGRFDAVVIDEASMASAAQAFAVGALAQRRIVAIGDPQQLSPIARARTPSARACLGQSAFDWAGCGDPSEPHPLRRMLVEQRRMHPQIRTLVSDAFYAGALRDAVAVLRRPALETGVLLLDTGGLAPRIERRRGSKRNPAHAALIGRLLAPAGARAWATSVAVIAPYWAQARLLRTTLPADLDATASTVHAFQGAERDVVVFDTTDATGGVPRFLRGSANPDAPRLINVALSRARQLLILVADVAFLDDALPDEPLTRILRAIPPTQVLRAERPDDLARARRALAEVASLASFGTS